MSKKCFKNSFFKQVLISYWVLAFIILAPYTAEGTSMSFFSTVKKIVLASSIDGVLTLKGKPVSGIKIERRLEWYDGNGSAIDFVVTNKSGHFSLPIIQEDLKIGKLVEFVVSQKMVALYQGEEILIWYMGDSGTTEYGELGGKPINFRCDIEDEERVTRNYRNPLMTRCSWDGLEPWTDTE